MRFNKCLIGNFEPPDRSVLELSADISSNDDKKISFRVTNGQKYESFDNLTFFSDTVISHVMAIDADGLYDAEPIQE